MRAPAPATGLHLAPDPGAWATGRVLVVDDRHDTLSMLRRMLERDGHSVDGTTDGAEVLRLVAEQSPDLVLLDVMMPGQSGFDICRAIKQHPETMLTPVVLVTALREVDDRIRGIEAGADDFLTKPVNMQELQARARSLVRLKRHTDELDSAESVIMSLALTIEARDASTEGHCQRLAYYAVALGRALGLPPADLAALRRGGYLHDVGKVGIPDAILLKPSRFTPEEHRIMQAHTVIGERLCGELRSLRQVRVIVRSHHERLDGSGYPDGLRGNDVPLLAQIMGIVDVYDALTSARPYKPALPMEQAITELYAEVAQGWRSAPLVDVFVDELRHQRISPPRLSAVRPW